MTLIWLLGCLWLNLYYAVQFICSYLFWNRIPIRSTPDSDVSTNCFSLIVPARNEELNIETLMHSLTSLEYSRDQFEIIIVDDFSEDGTVEEVKKQVEKHSDISIKLISLGEIGFTHNRAFKKVAIQIGVSQAQFEWIVTTDADCIHPVEYLKTLDAHIEEHQPKFVSGPVSLEPASTAFQKMQSLEFKGLVGLGAAYLERDLPFLCNGANLAFTKEVFENLNGFKGVDHMESGDDIWFMHKVNCRYPFELSFAKAKGMMVKTLPQPTLKDFVNQRKRWTAKNSSYTNWRQLFTLAMDYLFYVAILVNLLVFLIGITDGKLLLFMLGTKALVELAFYGALNRFYPEKNWLLTYLYTFPIQIFYVVLIYPLSQLTRFEWKNRRFNA